MGNQLSQAIKEFSVTTDSIVQTQKVIKQSQNNPEQQTNWLPKFNIFNNYGYKQVKFDFTSFRKKPYFSDATDKQIAQHLAKVQKKQNLLKKFKYWEDFDRIDHRKENQFSSLHFYAQKIFFYHIVFSIILGRISAVMYNNAYISTALTMKSICKHFIMLFPIPVFVILKSELANPINQQFFKANSQQMRNYLTVDYGLDAYKYVKDVKYNFKYPSQIEYQTQRMAVNKKLLQQPAVDAINYYKRKYGIIKVPQFQVEPKNEQI